MNKIESLHSHITSYNALALHYQDEIYTLAYYVLGNEQDAADAVQAAVEQEFGRNASRLDVFRLDLLRWTYLHCARRRIASQRQVTAWADALSRQLAVLNQAECAAAVLVDMLNLSYAEAARVLGCSTKQAARFLAHARLALSQQPAVVG